MNHKDAALPLVYSCSGCSSAAQTANAAALELDSRGSAQMSCIAGVGGGVAPLVRLAQSGRTIVAIDGCALACARQCLAQHGIAPTHHVLLPQLGVKKKYHTRYDPQQVAEVVQAVEALTHPARQTLKETTV
ncbi:putative zinc-binding protein [Pseudoduganella aquatica]|uniref:Zinc-binding protein n=1 Tax=Pseudoduganella aquatica TaxID=2660641 RepID=A0A7X4HF74_9BURK|nr:putative zinc-binding protein [Pseudoduganella aquatica]MYN10158.1 zinc-binding protein [Pseudoduganella aquatica]